MSCGQTYQSAIRAPQRVELRRQLVVHGIELLTGQLAGRQASLVGHHGDRDVRLVERRTASPAPGSRCASSGRSDVAALPGWRVERAITVEQDQLGHHASC